MLVMPRPKTHYYKGEDAHALEAIAQNSYNPRNMFSQKGYGIMIKNGVPVTVETGSEKIDADLLHDLPYDEIARIGDWIKENIRHADAHGEAYNSYGLKHRMEREIGIYVTNNQFKHAMLLAGYRPHNPNVLNWEFDIELRKNDIKNPNPMFSWLEQYLQEDSIVGDFARDTIADPNFPVVADYKIIRCYLEHDCVDEAYMRCFEAAWERWKTERAEPSSEGKAGKKGAVRKKRNSTQAAQTKQSAQETQ